MTGRVKTINWDTGFGFIRDDAGADFFFHRTDCLDAQEFFNLKDGDRVTFDIVTPEPSKGPRATAVASLEGGALD